MSALSIDSAQGVVTLLLSGGALSGGIWHWLIRPLHQLVDELADVPEYNGRIKRLEREVLPNGDDHNLPPELEGKPLRSIVIARAAENDRQFADISRKQQMTLDLLREDAEGTADHSRRIDQLEFEAGR